MSESTASTARVSPSTGGIRTRRRRPSRGLAHRHRLLLLSFAGGLPAVVATFVLLLASGQPMRVVVTVGLVVVLVWLACALLLLEQVTRPLQIVSSMLAALREGDSSLKAHGIDPTDPLGQVMIEINAMADTMARQRLGEREALALVRHVVEGIDVVVFAFDDESRVILCNRAVEKLMNTPCDKLMGKPAAQLGLAPLLSAPVDGPWAFSFPGKVGRWSVRRGPFREGGRPHTLVILSDISQTLRAEELQAWRSIIRVLGHEINNSLAPIHSIAGSLSTLVKREPLPDDWRDDLNDGLAVIATRSAALSRFTSDYARLARLPPPTFGVVAIGPLVERIAALETRVRVEVLTGPELTLEADAAQLEQVLINLVKNAAEAAQETRGGVRVAWRAQGGQGIVEVEDDGPGLANPANLFVPFFTTKPGGSGIGLSLCRQIVEAHGGTLQLVNRSGAVGCLATVSLPLVRPAAPVAS